ncbi:MAG: hypothetical protein IKP68_01905 [Clostridia bacterium]|nr:hypothetical protein [Clostridia bacterium]
MLYHASDTKGIKVLEPRASSHGVPYVYAIGDRLTSLLFGAPKDDFDLLIDEVDGVTVIYECYPDALEKIYKGKCCSLYTVSGETFESGVTGWDAELVSRVAVPVVKEEFITDIYRKIKKAAECGECKIHRYSTDPDYLDFLREELAERVRAFGKTDKEMDADERFRLYHNALLGR